MKFIIYAPSYDVNSGGCIVLHKLAHLINTTTEHEAVLVPRVLEIWRIGGIRKFFYNFARYLNLKKNKILFETNPSFNSPVQKKLAIDDLQKGIVIYPEVTYGNPLKARNTVRWFLHQPGYFTKEIFFGVNELYFKFNSAIHDFKLYNSKTSDSELKVIHYPVEIYNLNQVSMSRNGSCYMIRKGKKKNKIHDKDSICLDGMSHIKIAEIFKKTKRFICYDDYTAYSIFAVLCGCESIVVPSDDVRLEQWYPNETDRYGIAYGDSLEQLQWARTTSHKVREHIENEHHNSIVNIVNFINECQKYFFDKQG